jgi:hypothetical protein
MKDIDAAKNCFLLLPNSTDAGTETQRFSNFLAQDDAPVLQVAACCLIHCQDLNCVPSRAWKNPTGLREPFTILRNVRARRAPFAPPVNGVHFRAGA